MQSTSGVAFFRLHIPVVTGLTLGMHHSHPWLQTSYKRVSLPALNSNLADIISMSVHILLAYTVGPKQLSWLVRCPYFRGRTLRIYTKLGLGQVSWLTKCSLSGVSFKRGSTVHVWGNIRHSILTNLTLKDLWRAVTSRWTYMYTLWGYNLYNTSSAVYGSKKNTHVRAYIAVSTCVYSSSILSNLTPVLDKLWVYRSIRKDHHRCYYLIHKHGLHFLLSFVFLNTLYSIRDTSASYFRCTLVVIFSFASTEFNLQKLITTVV